jgi:hypothetical protein
MSGAFLPASKQKHISHTVEGPDLGEDLIGQDFEDDGIIWTVTKQGRVRKWDNSYPILL